MVEARATWVDEERFVGQASSGHGIVVDGAQVKSGNRRFVRMHSDRRGKHPSQEA